MFVPKIGFARILVWHFCTEIYRRFRHVSHYAILKLFSPITRYFMQIFVFSPFLGTPKSLFKILWIEVGRMRNGHFKTITECFELINFIRSF